MELFYYSNLCSKQEFTHLFNSSQSGLSQQMQKYHLVLASGFVNLENITLTAITARPVTKTTNNKLFFAKKKEFNMGINYYYLPFVNIKLIKSLIVFVNAIIYGIILGFKKRDKTSAVIGDVLNIPLFIAGKIVGKLLNIPVIGIVTDVPGYRSVDEGFISLPKRLLIKYHQKIIQKSDGYVFLSEFMNKVINSDNKPFSIIEGQVDSDMIGMKNICVREEQKKIIMYAGSVNEENGVDLLTKAFLQANIQNAELHIYGKGSYSNELKVIEKSNSRVRYYGPVSNDIIIKKEMEADLLVNPRPTHREFVKYSFPSKIMEYLVSGTPLLTTKIPSMPDDYKEYVFLIDDESIEGITKSLKSILLISRQELNSKGELAKQFVLENKNNKVQAKKIIKMIKQIRSRKDENTMDE